MAKLDIIITHYDEPWEVGKPFFDMLELQHSINRDDFTVTLVQDGHGTSLPFDVLLSQYQYDVRVITIEHAGMAAARNAGFANTGSEWVMFCDFDDMFADVCSLRMILDNIPVNDYDLIWSKCVLETMWQPGDSFFFNCCNESDLSTVVGKLYRRAFLQEKNITFFRDVPMFTDYMFNSIVIAETQPFRLVKLETEFYPYLKAYRKGSFHLTESAMHEIIDTRFDRDLLLAREFAARGLDYEHRKVLAYLACAEYFRIYDPEKEQHPRRVGERFLQFYKSHRDVLHGITPAELDVIKDDAEVEVMAIVQKIFNDHKIEYYLVNDTLSFDEWLHIVDQLADIELQRERSQHQVPSASAQNDPNAPVVIENRPVLYMPAAGQQNEMHVDVEPVEEQAPSETPQNAPRVAVYCGTYNTYMNMMTSAKSLLWHTRMDKIYFLIEDDKFPYELPDIIETINVKNQTWFPSDGPNYNNSWSYMCMMRAIFSKIIPYDKILSLDIDVVIQEDIGCLWDIDLSDYYLAGVTEPCRQKSTSDPPYINFGVVMMNLAKLRHDGLDDKIIDALNNTKLGCPEQDAFNKLCAWHIYQLPNDYNATIHSHITGEAEKERIIHYAGIRFWRHFGQVKEYALRSWDSIMERQNTLKAGDQS